ncbi:hypothetical protein Tco_1193072 [Tanacetum coccineum]
MRQTKRGLVAVDTQTSRTLVVRNMSNPDELRHTDNTTLVPPRFPDTLPQVYHRRRPTLGLLILPSVSPFPPTIRATHLRGQVATISRGTWTIPNACIKELETFMTLWDVKPRVEESSLETLSMDELITQLRQMCEDAKIM